MGLGWKSVSKGKLLGFRILLIIIILPLFLRPALAQTTGNIAGKVTDTKDAAVSGARVTITDKATGRAIGVSTASSGTYVSGELAAGDYMVRVEAKNLKTAEASVTVSAHASSSANFKLEPPAVLPNIESSGVERVLAGEEIEDLPVNGRVFFEPAQREAGLQLQDGSNFDPAKSGFSSVAWEGRNGRAMRTELDGIDITDETVGGPIQNVPLGAIREFSIQQSLPDLPAVLASAGVINVVTKSGSDGLHGEGFYNFRDQALDAGLPGASHSNFRRNQLGGNVGGAIVPNKVFFFVDAEHSKQDLANPVVPQGPLTNLAGAFSSPFRETQLLGRLDWTINNHSRFFYRFSFDQNRSIASVLPISFQTFAGENHSPSHAIGLDFATGNYTHTIRIGYTRFHNQMTGAGVGSSVPNPVPGIELGIGADPFCLTPGVNQFCSGPSYLAPQTTFQSDREFRYDGSKSSGSHNFSFGAGFNRIQGAVLASFLAAAPSVGASASDCARYSFCVAGDPSTYPVINAILGNGQGAFSDKSAFGLNGGALGPDNRLSWYVGDSWRVKQNLTVRYGVSYVRDSGRTDSDLPSIPALNQFGPGFGDRVRQPNNNFAPQFGIAWDPGKSGKTVLRGGIGLFYDNSIWNNLLFDRAGRLQQGSLQAFQPACAGGVTPAGGITLPDGTLATPSFCGQPVGAVATQIMALQQQYQTASASGSSVNPVYAGNILADGRNATGTGLLYPHYLTPRSVQMNLGLQRQLGDGVIFTLDYLRNVGTHSLQSIDTNHVGAARYLDSNAALAAISATNNLFGCGSGTASVDIDCAIAQGAVLRDFASNGLDSAGTFCLGLPCGLMGTRAAAFPGANPALGTNQMLFPMGRSVYNGIHLSLRQELHNPFRSVRSMNLQLSYALSKYVSTSRDTDFISFSTDNDNPLRYMGPNSLDRRHQVSFGSALDIPKNFRVSFIGHFYSPLPVTLTLDPGGAGSIFVSDATGDGTDGSLISSGGFGDVLPGTSVGALGRSIKASSINTAITAYNTNLAGRQSPAGQALINAGLFSLNELTEIGAALPQVTPAPATQARMAWLKDLDLSLSWAYKFKESVELRPGVSFYNAFNFANFNGPNNPLSGILDGTSGSVNGTAGQQPNANRLGLGTGMFGLGAPRVAEFTLKITF